MISIKTIDSKLYIKYDQTLYYKGESIHEFEVTNGFLRKCIYPELQGDTLIFSISQEYTELLYAYKNYPIVNLYGSYDIPIAPFRININNNV